MDFAFRQFAILLSVVCLALVDFVRPAAAALQFCNRTSYVLYTAYGYRDNTNIATKGWVRVLPGSCVKPIATTLRSGPYYVYAQTSRAHGGPSHAWAGDKPLCVRHGSFSFLTSVLVPGCFAEDAFSLSFASVQPKHKKSWTTTFTEPAIGTLAAASSAGLQRLLNDNGYKAGNPGSGTAKPYSDALAQFRTRAQLPATTNNEQLFNKLEAEALKRTAPTGYSICNAAKQAVWAAIGFGKPNNWTVQGWWKVPEGTCTTAMSAPLTFDSVFLHAEFSRSKPVVSGPAKFCVTDVQFEVHDRDHCKTHGLTEVGFAETKTKGRSGYAAHIGPNGLLP